MQNLYSLLSILNEKCVDSSFYVLEYEDFKACSLDRMELMNQISYLKDRGYIKVSFASEDEYCLALQPKGRLNDDVSFTAAAAPSKPAFAPDYKKILRYAFWGGLLGGAAVALLMEIFILIIS